VARNLLRSAHVQLRATHTFAASLLLCTGCFAPIKTLVEPSAIEQQMANEAITRCVDALAIDQIDPAPRYALRVAASTGVDSALIRARLEQRLADANIRLHPDTARRATLRSSPTLLAVLPVAGVDLEATLIGIPFVVPGMPVALGDVSVYKSSTLTGRARLELSVWSSDRREIAVIPATQASRYYRNVTVMTFIGPFVSSNLDEPLPGEEP
jgi:hypothetical protein